MQTTTKQELRDEIKALWIKACNYQGIDEDESFVCFEKDNPYSIEYDKKNEIIPKNQKVLLN
jgi:hypothetical protein